MLSQIIKTEKVPIYLYLDKKDVEPDCFKQIQDIANLEPAYHHVAVMPDTHLGFGMPIGGVLALDQAICPNAVGVDIGCGVRLIQTSLKSQEMPAEKRERVLQQISRVVPTGFYHHKKSQERPDFFKDLKLPKFFNNEIKEALKQLGTLGGGNHFIEWQKDEEENLYVMIHCGSRHFGKKINDYYHRLAKEWCQEQKINLPTTELAYFSTEVKIGQEYIYAMQLAIDFAEENRKRISEAIKKVLIQEYKQVDFGIDIDVHHNYAAEEEHFNKKVWVHRKGAVLADKGRKVLVPGSLMTPSFIGIGQGAPDSFNSCSHGAGRTLGRRQAKRQYSMEQILKELREGGIVLVKAKKGDIAEESVHVYKDIMEVMRNQESLVKIDKKLMPLGVLMG